MTLTDAAHTVASAAGRVGDSPVRPDGIVKAQGSFAFSSDLPIDGAAWGATLRSPHPYARIVSIDASRRWRSPASRRSSPPTTCRAGRRTG